MARAHTSPTVMGGLLALALTPAFWPGGALAQEDEVAACDNKVTDLIAGRTNDAGNINVCNDSETLTVTYEATWPFCLLDTQLHVATIPEPPAEPDDNIPQNQRGEPTPGQFSDFGLPDEGCQGTATYTIPLAEIGDGVVPEQTLAIAARADVEDEDGRVEEAWGAGIPFVDRGSWATYFTYTLQVPSCGRRRSFP